MAVWHSYCEISLLIEENVVATLVLKVLLPMVFFLIFIEF